MRYTLTLVVAAAIFASPLLTNRVAGQQEQPQAQPQPQRNSVQVGVPEGRQGGARQGGQGRGRQAGPAKPAPRRSDGRVILRRIDTG
jgi:hypothetical protein